MRIAYNGSANYDETVFNIIEIDKNIRFNFTNNTIIFWRNIDNVNGDIRAEYIVDNIHELYEQMLKEGYIDLTMYELYNEWQNVPSKTSFYLTKKGKTARKPLDYYDEDEQGIESKIMRLEEEIKEWKEMKEKLNKEE